MSDSAPNTDRPVKANDATAPASTPAVVPGAEATPRVDPANPAPAAALTPEEQMERFARDLKENDWGHQPC